MNEQQPILPGGCYQPNAKKLGMRQPDPLPPPPEAGWVHAILRSIERKIGLIGRAILAFFKFSMGLFLAYGLWRIQITRDMAKEARAEHERTRRPRSN